MSFLGQASSTSAAYLSPASAIGATLVHIGGDVPSEKEWMKDFHEAIKKEQEVLTERQPLYTLREQLAGTECKIVDCRLVELKLLQDNPSLCAPIPPWIGAFSFAVPTTEGAPDSEMPPATPDSEDSDSDDTASEAGSEDTATGDTATSTSPDNTPDLKLVLQLGEATRTTLSAEYLASKLRVQEAEMTLACLMNEAKRAKEACDLCDVHISVLRERAGQTGEKDDEVQKESGDNRDEVQMEAGENRNEVKMEAGNAGVKGSVLHKGKGKERVEEDEIMKEVRVYHN